MSNNGERQGDDLPEIGQGMTRETSIDPDMLEIAAAMRASGIELAAPPVHVQATPPDVEVSDVVQAIREAAQASDKKHPGFIED